MANKIKYNQQGIVIEGVSGIHNNNDTDNNNLATIGDVKELAISGGGVSKEYVDSADGNLQGQINSKPDKIYVDSKDQILDNKIKSVEDKNTLQDIAITQKVNTTQYNSEQATQDNNISANQIAINNLTNYIATLTSPTLISLNGTNTTLTTTPQQAMTGATITVPTNDPNKLSFNTPNFIVKVYGNFLLNVQADVDPQGGGDKTLILELRDEEETVLSTRTTTISNSAQHLNININYNFLGSEVIPKFISLYVYDNTGTTTYNNIKYQASLTEPTSGGGGGASTTTDLINVSTQPGENQTQVNDNIKLKDDTQDVLLSGLETDKLDKTIYDDNKVVQESIDATQNSNIALIQADIITINSKNSQQDSRLAILEGQTGGSGVLTIDKAYIGTTDIQWRGQGYGNIQSKVIGLITAPYIGVGTKIYEYDGSKFFDTLRTFKSATGAAITPSVYWNDDNGYMYHCYAVFSSTSNEDKTFIMKSIDKGATWTIFSTVSTSNTSSSSSIYPVVVLSGAFYYIFTLAEGITSGLSYSLYKVDKTTGSRVGVLSAGITAMPSYALYLDGYIIYREGTAIKRISITGGTPITMTLPPSSEYTISDSMTLDNEGKIWFSNKHASGSSVYWTNESVGWVFQKVKTPMLPSGGIAYHPDQDTIFVSPSTAGEGYVLKGAIEGSERVFRTVPTPFTGTNNGMEFLGFVCYNPLTKNVFTDTPGSKLFNYVFGEIVA